MTERILIVEDHSDNRRIMCDMLIDAGFDVVEAMTGEQGVEMAATHRPDLILMDLQLPEIDGFEATRRIKVQSALSRTPIIAVTSHALSGDEQKAIDAGCDAYFAKPVSPRKLVAAIRARLR
jgi:two-component system cell cycle response regulator DivK